MLIHKKKSAGFSLVEIIISISIVSVLMLVILFNYATSGDTFSVTAGGQEMAVTMRQAQSYGLSVRESAVSSGLFTYAYGVYVNPTTNPNDYLVFVDKNNDRLYTAGSGTCGANTTECIEIVALRNNVRISSIQDSTGATPAGATGVSITFLRPNPDAVVRFTNSAGSTVSTASRGRINLSSPKGKTYSVSIENNGQILAQ